MAPGRVSFPVAGNVPGPYDTHTQVHYHALVDVSYHALVRWAAIGLLLAVAALADAGPQVEIKAHTQLSLSRVKLQEPGVVEVTGQLVDKLTGEGISGQRVEVTIGDQRRFATTAPDGTFKLLIGAGEGPQTVQLSYTGGGPLDRADPLTVTTDPAKAQIELAIVKISDEPGGARLRVTATGDAGPIVVPVQLAVTAAADSEKFVALAHGVDTGTIFTLTRRDAGGAGLHRLRATFGGDDTRQGATTDVTLELTAATTTTIHVSATKLAYEDDLVVTGKVADDDDHPIARAAVTLTSGDRRLAQAVTDDDGSYRFKLEAHLLADGAGSAAAGSDAAGGQYGVQVQADPGASFVRPSRSAPEIVRVAAPQPVPVSYTIAAFVATALAAGGFFVARTKPWLRLRRPSPPAEVPSEEGEIEVATGGLVVAKPGLVSTLRRAADNGISGVVRDTVRGRPIPQAVVRLLLGETERELRTGADGSFVIEELEQGGWHAEVAALGHVTEKFIVTIPHRGELRGVRVDLVPVRERVFQLYRRAAEPILPEPRLWGIWSPRQIVDHVRTKRQTPALAELTDFVEEIYFSPRPAAETVLAHASERVDRAIHERTRAPR